MLRGLVIEDDNGAIKHPNTQPNRVQFTSFMEIGSLPMEISYIVN